MKQIERRLVALETTRRELGIRIFFQDMDDRSIYYEDATDTAWAAEQLDVLATAGWTVLRVEWVDDWRGD